MANSISQMCMLLKQRPAPPAALGSCPAAAARQQTREMSLTLLSPALPTGVHSSSGAAPIDGAAEPGSQAGDPGGAAP